MPQPDDPFAGAEIIARGKVPLDIIASGNRAAIGQHYQQIVDDLNSVAADIGWRGVAVTSHKFSAETGLAEIGGCEGKRPATLDHVRAISARGK